MGVRQKALRAVLRPRNWSEAAHRPRVARREVLSGRRRIHSIGILRRRTRQSLRTAIKKKRSSRGLASSLRGLFFSGVIKLEMKWRIVRVPGDGHCFYHSLLYALREIGLVQAQPESSNAQVVAFSVADVNEVKRHLLASLRPCLETSSGAGRLALEKALEGEEDGSAPLMERLTRDSSESCGLRHFATDAEIMLAAFAYDVCICVHTELGIVTYLPDLTAGAGRPRECAGARVLHLRHRLDHFSALLEDTSSSSRRVVKRAASWPPSSKLPLLYKFLCGAAC